MQIKELDPNNKEQLQAMNVLEKSAFELSGNDPTESSRVIEHIAREGKVFVGYETVDKKDVPDDLSDVLRNTKETVEIPVAFIELITLANGLKFYDQNKSNDALTDSPFMTSKRNADKVYAFARKHAKSDNEIVEHHGVGVHKNYQGKGLGARLLEYALNSDFMKGRVVVCNIDIAKHVGGNGFQDVFNDRSFAQHLKQGFITGEVLEPPVYEGTIVYASTLSIPHLNIGEEIKRIDIGMLRQNPANLVNKMKELHSSGYAGTFYDRTMQIMYFQEIKGR